MKIGNIYNFFKMDLRCNNYCFNIDRREFLNNWKCGVQGGKTDRLRTNKLM